MILPGNINGFVTAKTMVGFYIITTCRRGGIYIREVFGNESCPGQEFEFGKVEMPKYFMNSGKYFLFSMNYGYGRVYF